MKLDKFQKSVLLGISLIVLVAFMDRFKYPENFWGYSILLGVIASVMYYFFRKDKSEALAIFAAFYIMLIFGLEDLIFYIIQGGIPASMPHLFTHQIIGRIAMFMGLTTVTPLSLIVSVGVGGIITYLVTKYLRNKW